MTEAITFTLDGREVEARPGRIVWPAAKRAIARPVQPGCAESNSWR
jgi:hypothetical protein